jgi:hypothetical protein
VLGEAPGIGEASRATIRVISRFLPRFLCIPLNKDILRPPHD